MNESSIYSVRPSSSRDVTQIETRTLRNRFTPTTKPIFVLSISPDFYIGYFYYFQFYYFEKGKVDSKNLFPVWNWGKPRTVGESKSAWPKF